MSSSRTHGRAAGRPKATTAAYVEVELGGRSTSVPQEQSPPRESSNARISRRRRNSKAVDAAKLCLHGQLKAIKDGKRPLPAPPPAPFVDIIGPSFSYGQDDDGMAAYSNMRLHVGFVYVTDVSFSIVTNVFSRMNVCPSKYPTPKSSKITLRTVVKLNVPLCMCFGIIETSGALPLVFNNVYVTRKI